MGSVDNDNLVVIGAGLPRTGTLSLKTAFQELLGGKCHHMIETFENGTQKEVDFWQNGLEGKNSPEDWKKFFREGNFKSCDDYPSAFFYKELMNVYPDAKIILTVRNPEIWHDSVKTALMESQYTVRSFPTNLFLKLRHGAEARANLAWNFSWAVPEGFNHSMFSCIQAGKTESTKFFDQWKEEVIKTVPKDRLLVFEVQQGWKPLCNFLNVPIPNGPFPHVNDDASVKRSVRTVYISGWILVILGPILLALFLSKILF